MNTPVSFPIAKLLKERGFDKECRQYWNLIEYGEEWIVENRVNMDSVDFMYAPTIADVVMWVYEKREIWISVQPFGNEFRYFIQNVRPNNLRYDELGLNSPTEAYEAAITYTLNNLV